MLGAATKQVFVREVAEWIYLAEDRKKETAGSSEHSNEHVGSVSDRKFID